MTESEIKQVVRRSLLASCKSLRAVVSSEAGAADVVQGFEGLLALGDPADLEVLKLVDRCREHGVDPREVLRRALADGFERNGEEEG